MHEGHCTIHRLVAKNTPFSRIALGLVICVACSSDNEGRSDAPASEFRGLEVLETDGPEVEGDADVRTDVGTTPVPAADAVPSVDGGPTDPPLTFAWQELLVAGASPRKTGQTVNGNATLVVTSRRESDIHVAVEADWWNGIESMRESIHDASIEPLQESRIAVDLGNRCAPDGGLPCFRGVKVMATVYGSDGSILGTFSPPMMYFDRDMTGEFVVRNEVAMLEFLANTEQYREKLEDGNKIEVPDGAQLLAVIISVQGVGQ